MEKAANLDHKYFDFLGTVYNEAGNVPKAIEAFNKCLEINPESGDTKGLRKNNLNNFTNYLV